jgi:hypothetical protein
MIYLYNPEAQLLEEFDLLNTPKQQYPVLGKDNPLKDLEPS